jgi:hypothetical protein
MNQSLVKSDATWTDTRRIGALAAFVLAVSPVLAIAASLAATAAGERSDLVNGLAFMIKQPVFIDVEGAVSVLIGASLIVLALALHERLQRAAPFAVRIGTAAGVIGSALFITAGVASLDVPTRMATLEAQNHEAAVAAFAAFRIVGGFMFTAGLVMFGAFALIDSVISARARQLPRPLSYMGMLLGIASIVGAIGVLAGPLGIVSLVLVLVWPVWLGIAMLRSEPYIAPALGAKTQAHE